MRYAALAALVVCGCLSPVQQRKDNLIREARIFNDDFRWARFEQLQASLPPEDGKLFLSRVEAAGEDLVMADFEITAINFAAGNEAANVVVKFEWYMKREARVRGTTLDQRWEYQGGKWLCTKQRRLRGDRFPLIPEPLPAPDAKPAAAAP